MFRKLAMVLGLMMVTAAPPMLAPAEAALPTSYTLNGTWRSNDGLLSGPWSATFSTAGYDLSGTLNIIGLPGVAEANISGSWDAGNFGFGVLFLGNEIATFTGGIQGDGFFGAFEGEGFSGTWSGSFRDLSSISGSWSPIFDENVPTLILSRIQGYLGQIVTFTGKLRTAGQQLRQLDSVFNFDRLVAPVLARLDGTPDCSVNPLLQTTAIFEFLPLGCSGSTCNAVHAILDSATAALPDDVALFTCKVKVAKTAILGIYQLVVSQIQGLTTTFSSIDLGAVSGELSVVRRLFGGCQCSTLGEAGPMPLASLLAPLALVVVRRRVRNRSRRDQIEG